MFASYEYQLSKDEYASGLRLATLALTAQDRRRAWWPVGYLMLIGLAVAVASAFHPGSFDGIVSALVILMIGLCSMQMLRLRILRELSFEADGAHRKVTLDANGVAEWRGLVEAHWPWSGVRRIYDQADSVVLQVSGWHLILLPNRLWPGSVERAEFIKQVRDRATNLLPDLKSYAFRTSVPSTLLAAGAVAAALDAFVLVSLFERKLVCPCTLYGLFGHNYALFAAVWIAIPFLAAAAVWKLAQTGLRLLNRHDPGFASMLSKLFIVGVCVALLAGSLAGSS